MAFTKNQTYFAERQRIINKKTLNKKQKDSRQNRIVAADKEQKVQGSHIGSMRSLSRIEARNPTGIIITRDAPSMSGVDPMDEDNPYANFCEYYKEDSEYPFTTLGDLSEHPGSRQLATDESKSRVSSRTDLERSRLTSSKLLEIRGKRPEKYKFPFLQAKTHFPLPNFHFYRQK